MQQLLSAAVNLLLLIIVPAGSFWFRIEIYHDIISIFIIKFQQELVGMTHKLLKKLK